MQLSWGNYDFPVNAAEVTSRSRTVFSYTGRPIRYILTYDVLATLFADGQKALSTEEDKLRTALYTPYKNLILKTDAGSASSANLINNKSITGVRLVSGPDFGEAKGGEFVNRRTASFSMEAEYILKGTENAVISWQESVTIVGNGGPDRFWRFPLNANPIRQQKTPYSLITATQQGQATGHTRRPTRPLPMWPDFLVNPSDTTGGGTPEPKGLAFLNWPIQWAYQFQSGITGSMIGFPSLPPMP
jgi:hypothetical protein